MGPEKVKDVQKVTRLHCGFTVHDDLGDTYFVPSFIQEDGNDSDFIMDVAVTQILVTRKGRGKKLYEGYHGRLSKTISEFQEAASETGQATLIENLKKAINYEGGLWAELNEDEKPECIDFMREADGSSGKFFRLPLIKVDLGVSAGQLLESTLKSLETVSKEFLDVQQQVCKLQEEKQKTKECLDELTIEKHRGQDRMLRAFTVAMNAQKEGYVALQEKYNKLLQEKGNQDVIEIEDEEMPSQRTAGPAADDSDGNYDMETDVEDDEPSPRKKKPVELSEVSDMNTCESQTSKAVPCKPVKSVDTQGSNEDDGDETDFNDSQEIVIPKAVSRSKYRSPFKNVSTPVANSSDSKAGSSKHKRQLFKNPKSNSSSLLAQIFPDSQ